jgi:serine/threonine-protein kinase
MTGAERWQRVQELFEAALDLPAEEREAYLRAEAGDDAELMAEVASLLAADSGPLMDRLRGLVRDAASDLADATAFSWIGRTVGRYRLLREIARGGMGTVYLAERADAAYEARVAIKFVRASIAAPEVLRRFLAERQILADLRHPNIARLLDGGAADDGTPYLVMEYIDGQPIDEYADRHGLDVRERLLLFRKACDAVQHAHGRLVVHRDIKPSNILVSEDGTPKLVDFGVAKLLEPSGAEREGPTQTAMAGGLLTPAYASPEQVRGEPITTSADVYALGILLYKLLTGALPYGASTRRGTELARAILEEPPQPPSRAQARPVSPDASTEPLDRDLDAILLTALEKEPSRRYPSVERLSDDIGRYLDRQPVLARPATRAYRLRKFVSRHRGGVLAGVGIAALVLGLSAFYTARLAHERDLARQETRKAEQVTTFLERLFQVSDPSEARGATITAREVLDSAVQRVPTELADQPEVQAALLYTLGNVYSSLGLERDARSILERGLELRRRIDGDDDPSAGAFLRRLGMVETQLGQFDSAAVLIRSAIERLEGEPDGGSDALAARVNLVAALRRTGRLSEADSVVLDAIARARRSGPDSMLTLALNARVAVLLNQRKAVEAEPLAREGWERNARARGEDDPVTITSLNNLGQALYLQSKLTEAEPIMRRVLELRRRVVGDDNPFTGTAWNNLSALLQAQGRPEEAEQTARKALAILRTNYGDDHQRVSNVMSNLGSMLLAQGRLEEAEQMDRDALAIMGRVLAPGHVNIAVAHNNLAHVVEEQGHLAEAEAEYRSAIAEMEKNASAPIAVKATFFANLGRVLDLQGRTTEAEETLRKALSIQREYLPSPHANTATTLALLGDLLVRTNRAADAEPLLREALQMREAILAPDHWGIALTRSVLGQCLAALGERAEADTLLSGSAAALEASLGVDDERTRASLERAQAFYERIGDRARAAVARRKLAASEPTRRPAR